MNPPLRVAWQLKQSHSSDQILAVVIVFLSSSVKTTFAGGRGPRNEHRYYTYWEQTLLQHQDAQQIRFCEG
jgi:hypothetical protein